jgi:hypothetical protein
MSLQRFFAIGLAAFLALAADVDEPTAAAALREALGAGAREAVALAARTDGFYGNPRIRIPLPESLRPLARGLRSMGMKRPVEEFELAMNRSAEHAAGEALDVLAGAIASLKLTDARAILRGGDTAGTDYLRRTTTEELRERFAPIVRRGMRQVGLVQSYERLVEHWRALPGAAQPQLDLESYVTDETLDGLYLEIAEQERRVRREPAARTTALLERVFGALDAPVGQR